MGKVSRLWWVLGLTGLCSLSYLAFPGCGSSGDDDDSSSAGDDDSSNAGDDDSSSAGDDDATSPSGGTMSIFDLNRTPPDNNTDVVTTGVITAITYKNDFWISDPASGPYSGIYVYAEEVYGTATSLPFKVGDEVKVTGLFSIYYDLREIAVKKSGGSVEVTKADAGVPTPIQVGLNELVLAACTKGLNSAVDPYVGALLSLPEATVIVAEGACDNNPKYGYWEIQDDQQNTLMVDDDVKYDYEPAKDDKVTLTGVLTYNFEQYKLEPAGNGGIQVAAK
jgi:hypothetical protein